MSRVLFLVNHDVVIYNFRLELVERLLNDGHEVYISSPYGERIEDLKKIGAKYCEINIERHGMNPLREVGLIFEYKKLIRDIKPNIVFAYTIKPNIYGAIACKDLNVPCVANITGLGTAVENGGIKQRITIALYRFAFKKIQRVFFQNTENMQFFVDHKLALGKHSLLPGSGVNLERFSVMAYPKDDTVRFFFIARIMKEKGIDYFLEAAKYIKGKYPNTEFHVCGFVEDEYKGKLEEMASDGTIIYHGMIRDIRTMHSVSSCTVFPSYYPEGLSNVLLESAACARPIITTDRAGCREAVDDGVSGFLIPIKDQKALNEALERFLGMDVSEREQMGLAGRKKVAQEFDRQIIVETYLRELE